MIFEVISVASFCGYVSVSILPTLPSFFFQGMNKSLFGRPPVSELARMERARAKMDSLCFDQLGLLFGSFIPTFLLSVGSSSGANSRRRIFTPTVTFWAFLEQVLDPEAPCRKALAQCSCAFCITGAGTSVLRYWSLLQSPPSPARSLALQDSRLHRQPLDRHSGGRTLLVDGTGIVVPDTPKNQRRFPQSKSQKRAAAFH